ncbi:MAG: glycosyltransferase [Crocinitomicaceae bacterium]
MRPDEIRNKKVLLSPLNWGMGHVSRTIGLIHQFISQGNTLVLACDDFQSEVYRSYFPEIIIVEHKGYPFDFGGKGNFAWDLGKNLSALKVRMKQEQLEVEAFVKEYDIEVVLSDHRYGFFSKQVTSVFLTHQYHLPVSGLLSISDNWHKKRMRPFDHIWILDAANSRLSGKLTENIKDDRVLYIGAYSRFSIYEEQQKLRDVVVVVSGPQVYAQQFADEMSRKYPKAMFICPNEIHLDDSIERISGTWLEQDAVILQAKRLISRSGYSTIMDLEILKISAELHPTPGQAEQIYLHQRLTDCSEYNPSTLHDHSYEQKSQPQRRN